MDTPIPGHEPSRQTPVIVATAVMLALSTTTVALRFYTRRVFLSVLGAEDWAILAALILSVGVTVGFVRQTQFALGRHVWMVTEDDMLHFNMEGWYTMLFYATSLSCTKISILLLYRRFLLVGWARVSNSILLALVGSCAIWILVSSFIDCIPLQAVWDRTVEGKCLSLPVKIGNTYAHIITDFLIFFLPIPFVITLRLPRRQKIGLMLVFCVGFVACLISILRIAILSTMDFSDFTYSLATLNIWGAVEVNLAIICACLTTLKPLVARVFPRLLQSSDWGPSGSLGYIERRTWIAVSAPRNPGAQAKQGSNKSSTKRDQALLSNDSVGCEMDGLEEGHIQRGVHVVTPAKAHTRLP